MVPHPRGGRRLPRPAAGRRDPRHGTGTPGPAVTIAWGDIAVLAALIPVALLGACWAEALRPRAPAPTVGTGHWMTIVVESSDPSAGASRHAPLPRLPRNDPERRRLSRRVERTRELVSAGIDD